MPFVQHRTEFLDCDACVAQVREFNYNNLGNLLSEEHPEKDGPVTYSDYDALGHAGRKIDGPGDLVFTWDRATPRSP